MSLSARSGVRLTSTAGYAVSSHDSLAELTDSNAVFTVDDELIELN